MGKKDGFDVLRLIEHGDVCYVSSEYLPGKQLVYWLKEGKTLRKEILYQWLRDMVKQLMRIYRCQGNQGYGYVNPYCILIAEDCSLFYLDMNARSNEEILKQMSQDPVIRHYFISEESTDCKQRNLKGELYGMGKTVQYILAAAYIRPELTRREERKLEKFISKCLGQTGKKELQDVSQLLPYLPEPAGTGNKLVAGKTMKVSVKIGIAVVVLVVAAGVHVFAFKGEIPSKTDQAVADEEASQTSEEQELSLESTKSESLEQKEEAKEKEAILEQSDVTVIKLALNYFLELDQPTKALNVLKESLDGSNIKREEMEALACVIQAFLNQDEQLSDEEDFRTVEKALEVIRNDKEIIEDQEKAWCLVRGFGILTEKSKILVEEDEESFLSSKYANRVIATGEEYLQKLGIEFPMEKDLGINVKLLEEERSEKAIKEIKQTMAKAYEAKGNFQLAVEEWQAVLDESTEWGEREEIYVKIEDLYEADGQIDKASNICTQGLKDCYESWTLRKIHIRLLCSDKGMDRGICAQTIKDYLGQYPDLKEDEEFKELQEQYGIKIDGETVTVK